MKRKKLFISITAVAAVLLFLGIFILIWFVGDTYKDFERFRKEFAIEGLDDGAVPQGLGAYYGQYQYSVDDKNNPLKKTQQYFLTSAYMTDGSASRVYVSYMRNEVRDGKEVQVTGNIGYVTLVNVDGTPHTGHVGGIATNGSKLWVTYGDSVLVAKASEEYKNDNILAEIADKAAKNSENDGSEEILSIQFTASFKANCNAAYLYYYHDPRYTTSSYDRLYVGEFYRKGNYETEKSHHLKAPSGYKNTSFMYEYRVDSNTSNEYGLHLIDSNNNDKTLSENVPKIQKIYSLPEKIQGVAFSKRSGYGSTDGIMVLSQSYGLSNSHLLCFDWSKMHAKSTKYTSLSEGGVSFEYKDVYRVNGDNKTPYSDSDLLVYFADSNNRSMFLKDFSIPSMSEGMCNITLQGSSNPTQNRIYVVFESGSKKYNLFTRKSIKHVYSFIPNL